MTNAELIQKIKAEIERLKKRNKDEFGKDGLFEVQYTLNKLLSFIESMEQSIDADKMIGLDEAAADYAKRGYSTNADPFDEIREYQLEKDAFKAGAEWMAGQGVTTETAAKIIDETLKDDDYKAKTIK